MRYIKIGFIGSFICIIVAFFIMTIDNDNPVSYLEKRELQTFPAFSLERLGDDAYYGELTTAFSDQLEFRDLLVKGYYVFQFQRYNGDVVIGKNDELYAAYQRVDEATYLQWLQGSASYINEVSAEVNTAGAAFIFLSIPRKDAVEKENLPDSYISSEGIYLKGIDVLKNTLAGNVILLDAYEIFNEDPSVRYYYKTDHHITPRGAFALYEKILAQTDVAPYDIASCYDVEETIVKGSFNDQIGQSVKSEPEELSMVPHDLPEYTRYEDEKESDLPVFRSANTYEKCYMDGDQAYTIIDTGREELPNIMYVGSSFTNILEAISVRDFNKMVAVDYRDNKTGTSIASYVQQHDIDYVVYVPSQSNDAFHPDMMYLHLGR